MSTAELLQSVFVKYAEPMAPPAAPKAPAAPSPASGGLGKPTGGGLGAPSLGGKPTLPAANPTTPVLNASFPTTQTLAPPPVPPPAPVVQPAPQMTGTTQPQPVVSNTQGTMTDTSGQPVQTTPAQPKGPEAFVDAMKARSEGKEPTGGVIDMTKPLDVKAVEAHLGDVNVPPEQKQKFLGDLTEKLKHENPQYYQGFQDIQSGRTDTEAAKAYQGRLEQAKNEMVQQAAAADPQKAATPQGFGEIVNGVMNTFQNMPLPMQAMVGIGLPVGLIGIMSSMFGGGGMGMGVLGALGLGAGLLGGAAGGMFGQGASNMVGDTMYNMGSFLGMVPEKADLSALKGTDPLANLKAQGGGNVSREEAAKKLTEGRANAENLRKLMSLPVGDDVKIRLMQRLDPSIDSAEAGQQALQNAGTLLKAYDDPDSDLNKTMQNAEWYSKPTWGSWAAEKIGPARLQGLSDWLNGDGKQSADMNINKLIEKWAFNDMAAKKQSVDMCMKSARCWAGYEPVPGKKPYSEDSCRPVGSKKKKDTKKKTAK